MDIEWAKDSDCADCGASDAEYSFQGGESICKACAPQYSDEDITTGV